MTVPTNVFSRLSLEGWRQFKHVDLALHEQLTVLTGANGSGKTTILNILSQHFGWYRPYLATPRQSRGGNYEYQLGLFGSSGQGSVVPGLARIGTLSYSNGMITDILLPQASAVQYGLQIPHAQSVMGIHVPSHRTLASYQPVGQFSAQAIFPEQAYGAYHSESISRFQGGAGSSFSPLYRLKEALISMAVFGAGNEYVQQNEKLLNTYLGFIQILKDLLPDSIGFQNLSIRTPDIVMITDAGEFLIDAASGGVMGLIDIAWQIYLYSRDRSHFVVTIDEPENHLHPSMQRSVMRNLIRAFPRIQFIVATHSPFIVSSVKESNVFVLQVEGKGSADVPSQAIQLPAKQVVSTKLDTVNKAGSASEILREALGVRVTIPEWAEESLNAIVTKYRTQVFNEETLKSLRSDLAELGFSDLYPEAVAALVGEK